MKKQFYFLLSAAVCIILFVPFQTEAYTVSNSTIYDSDGNSVALHGVNWFGFETQNYVVHGLWSRNWKEMIDQMEDIGVNAVRIPVCPDTLHAATPNSIDYYKNKGLEGKNSLQILDTVVAEFDRRGMYVLLDHHRPDCNVISELWYTDSYSEQQWIDDLTFMANRYKQYKHVIGIDLKNEPHGAATWGTGNRATDWDTAAQRAGQAVLEAAPKMLVFVEGIQENSSCSGAINHWWGGNIEPYNCAPLSGISKEKLVLSPHVYGPDVYGQSYFYDSNFPSNMPAIWNEHFGFALKKGAALAIGEFGGKYGNSGDQLDIVWQNAFVDYAIEKGITNTFYWSWNPNSGDTGGILQDDWTTLHQNKVDLLQRLWNGTPASSLQKFSYLKTKKHTDADVRITITKKYIRTYNSTSGELIDEKRLFKNKRFATRLQRFNNSVDLNNYVVVLSRKKKKQKRTVYVNSLIIDENGTIKKIGKLKIKTKRKMKKLRNASLKKQSESNGTIELQFQRKKTLVPSKQFNFFTTGVLKKQ